MRLFASIICLGFLAFFVLVFSYERGNLKLFQTRRDVQTTTQPTLNWDWRKGHTLKDTGWPSKVKGDIWYIEEPTRVIIDLPGNKRFDMVVEHGHVNRDGDDVRSANFYFPMETTPEACLRAGKLMKEWNIEGYEKVVAWKKIPEHEREMQDIVYLPGPTKVAVSTGVRLGKSDFEDKPWVVIFDIGIDDDVFAPGRKEAKLAKLLATVPGEYCTSVGVRPTSDWVSSTTIDLNSGGSVDMYESVPCRTSITKTTQYSATGTWKQSGETITITLKEYKGTTQPVGDLQQTITLKRDPGGRQLTRDHGPPFERFLLVEPK